MGTKMKKEARLPLVGDEILRDFDVEGLKRFTNTKFLLAMAARDNPNSWPKLPEGSPQQQIIELRSQYRNSKRIRSFMHFQFKFVEKFFRRTTNPG